MNSIVKISFHFFNFSSFFVLVIVFLLVFAGRFVSSWMQQKSGLWLKFYSVHSFHDQHLKSAIGTLSLSNYLLILHWINLSNQVPEHYSSPTFVSPNFLHSWTKREYIQRNFEKVRVWVKSSRNVNDSEQQKWQCPELNLLILSGTTSIVDVANCQAVFLSFFSLEIFQMSNNSRLSRSINYSQSGLLHCEKW